MGNKMIDKAVNPFIQIAGARALAWGALGLLVSTVICYYAGYHYHGCFISVRRPILRGGAMQQSI